MKLPPRWFGSGKVCCPPCVCYTAADTLPRPKSGLQPTQKTKNAPLPLRNRYREGDSVTPSPTHGIRNPCGGGKGFGARWGGRFELASTVRDAMQPRR